MRVSHFAVQAGLVAFVLVTATRPREVSTGWSASVTRAAREAKGIVRIYPYSLIPGGVEDGGELLAYKKIDPDLSQHYQDLGPSLTVVKLSTDQLLYSSYRMSDGIYWTNRPLLVRSNEAVLTDGVHLIRARCGNQLSKTPRIPVRKFQPPAVAMAVPPLVIPIVPELPTLPQVPEAPELTPGAPPITELIAPPIAAQPIVPTGTSLLPILPGGRGPGILIGPGSTPIVPIAVPEPGTWSLLLTGFGVMTAAWAIRRTRATRHNSPQYATSLPGKPSHAGVRYGVRPDSDLRT